LARVIIGCWLVIGVTGTAPLGSVAGAAGGTGRGRREYTRRGGGAAGAGPAAEATSAVAGPAVGAGEDGGAVDAPGAGGRGERAMGDELAAGIWLAGAGALVVLASTMLAGAPVTPVGASVGAPPVTLAEASGGAAGAAGGTPHAAVREDLQE
jgi:hypothetical protein